MVIEKATKNVKNLCHKYKRGLAVVRFKVPTYPENFRYKAFVVRSKQIYVNEMKRTFYMNESWNIQSGYVEK